MSRHCGHVIIVFYGFERTINNVLAQHDISTILHVTDLKCSDLIAGVLLLGSLRKRNFCQTN